MAALHAATPTAGLTAVEALYASTVLEDTIDQLAVLGGVMPQGNGKKAISQSPADELLQILNSQRHLESRFDEVMSRRSDQLSTVGKMQDPLRAELHSLASSLERGTTVAMNIKDSAQLADNMAKLQRDRGALQSLLEATKKELDAACSFTTLSDTVKREKEKQEQEERLEQREKNSVARVHELHQELQDINLRMESKLQKENEEIAYLKDQLQETKAKTHLEEEYLKIERDLAVDISSRQQTGCENSLSSNLDTLQKQLTEEEISHAEMKERLRVLYEESSGKLEEWSNKYDADVMEKQEELDSLQMQKENDLLKLQQLTEKYQNYKEVVDDERKRKELLRKQEEQRIQERHAATKMQAWWRGCLVRHELGPYSKKKKKKKKGKGSGKKKKGKGGKKKKK